MKDEKMIWYKIAKPILGTIYKLWYNPKVIGAENIPTDGPIVVAGNHIHIMDQCNVIIATKRKLHYMAKKEYFDGKFAFFFKSVGCIPVDRSKKDGNAVSKALEVLNSGNAIGIFPEGTRNRTNEELLKFRYGAVKIAKLSNSKIIPFAIKGGYRIFRKGLNIEFGEPIDVSKMEIEEANEYVRDVVLKLLRKT